MKEVDLNTQFCLQDKVDVSADKAPNNFDFVFKSHCIDFLIKELGVENSLCNPMHIPR